MAGIRGLSQWETNKFTEKDERKNSVGDKKRERDKERCQKMEIWIIIKISLNDLKKLE